MRVPFIAFLLFALAACGTAPSATHHSSARTDQIIVIVRYTAQPGKGDQAIAAISELVAKVKSVEPQSGGITILRDTADKTKITLIEKWPSQEAFLGPHMKQPHIHAFIQSSRDFLAGPPEISFWNTL